MGDQATENDASTRNGTVDLDLTSLGGPKGKYPCRVIPDAFGRPDRLEIAIPNPGSMVDFLWNDPEGVRDQPAHVEIEGGTIIDAVLAIAGRPHGDLLSSTLTATLHISHSTMHRSPAPSPDRWRILFANAHLDGYDYGVRTNNASGWSINMNEIRFRLANRDWTFVDDLATRWRSPDKPDVTKPVAGVRLETGYVEGDTFDIVKQLATDIEALLRLALGRGVSWYSIGKLNANAAVECHNAEKWLTPYGNQSQVISNIHSETVKRFLESAYDYFAVDREWLTHTILQYVVSLEARHLEVRMSLQNTLLDRIASHVLRDDVSFEIDPAISTRLTKEFGKRLHSLLQELSPSWSKDRTGMVTQNIKGWNSSPSFPGAVERASVRLALWPPAKAQIHKRHKVIHEGAYDDSDGTNVFDYWKRVECLVVMLILRLLGYSGSFYHLALGPSDLSLASLMVGGSRLPPYHVEPQTVASVHRLVEQAAYLRWCGRSRPDGDPLPDWAHAVDAVARLAPMRKNA